MYLLYFVFFLYFDCFFPYLIIINDLINNKFSTRIGSNAIIWFVTPHITPRDLDDYSACHNKSWFIADHTKNGTLNLSI